MSKHAVPGVARRRMWPAISISVVPRYSCTGVPSVTTRRTPRAIPNGTRQWRPGLNTVPRRTRPAIPIAPSLFQQSREPSVLEHLAGGLVGRAVTHDVGLVVD